MLLNTKPFLTQLHKTIHNCDVFLENCAYCTFKDTQAKNFPFSNFGEKIIKIYEGTFVFFQGQILTANHKDKCVFARINHINTVLEFN